jgi:hypothetical protein
MLTQQRREERAVKMDVAQQAPADGVDGGGGGGHALCDVL